MTDLAINDKGEAMAFDGKAWKPAPIAENDKGERMAFDGKEWRALPKAEKSGAFDSTLKTADSALDFVNRNVINPIGTGLTKGTTAMLGAPRMAADLLQAGATWAGDKLGAPETGRKIGAGARFIIPGGTGPSTEDYNRAIFGSLAVPEENFGDKPALTLTNPFGMEGKVNVGKMMDTGIQAIPGALALGGGVLPSVMGGVTSEAAGQATQGTPYELPARIVGSLPGAWVGSKLTTPLPANLSPEQQRMVEIARERNIPLTVGQETGRGRGVESALSRFPTSEGVMRRAGDAQQQAINREALSEMNAVGNRVDPETMRRVGREASDRFNAARNASGDVTLRPDFYNRTNQIVAQYADDVPAGNQVRAVFQSLDNFMDPKLMRPGASYPTLSPTQYQEFRRNLTDTVERVADPTARRALQGVRESLDDAMQASLPADQAAAWQQARRDWANFKIISQAASGGTVESRQAGNLSPSSLTQALRTRQGADRFARTEGGMNDVARVAGYLADTRPNSGTPQTLMTQGAIVGAARGGPITETLRDAAALTGIPNTLARAMTGQGWATPLGPLLPLPASVVRNYLANQAQPNRLEAVSRVPFALAPGLLTDQRVRQ